MDESPTQYEPDPRPRYKLTLAYDGTKFHGWQKQITSSGETLRTVAGVVEQALQRSLRQAINLIGASRTDSGVHARGQVAHFNAKLNIPIERVAMALNSRLPKDVEVIAIDPADAAFSAIRNATSKQYRYRIFNTARRPLTQRHVVWHCWQPLEIEPMRQAAGRLIGTHDFAAFAAAAHGRTSTFRTIHDCRIETDPPQVHIVVAGSGFLYNMVRIIAGTLVEIGRGRLSVDIIEQMLLAGNRSQGGPTLPASGLCLEWIK